MPFAPRSSPFVTTVLFTGALSLVACSGSDLFEDGSGSGGGATATGAEATSSATTSTSAQGSTGAEATTTTSSGQGGQGGDGQGGDGQGGNGQGGNGQGGNGQGGGGGAPSCDLVGVDVVDESAFLSSDAGLLLYNGSSAEAGSILIVELWFQYGAEEASHSFEFTGENYADCHTCAVLARDCLEEGDCGRRFLVQSGTLEVQEIDLGDGRYRGTLTDAVAIEVTFDGSTSTPVPGGETWCVDEIDFESETIEDLPFPVTK